MTPLGSGWTRHDSIVRDVASHNASIIPLLDNMYGAIGVAEFRRDARVGLPGSWRSAS